ncbi:Alpha/Beta hydrolase protein [Aspergillus pseudoustus]|uniref:Alpha/Beta hydrolase protein n=1 Tax=Aspergillus pseudoustus TaxID=1810923 RepID=A0ABR4IVT6_9EURO
MDLKPTFTVVYKEINGSQILTDVFVPPPDSINRSADGNPTRVPVIYIIHGGGWLMGHPSMNPKAQIEDALERGWIVLAPDHRLCPQVTILDGPMGDIRSLHAWVHGGLLDAELKLRSIPLAAARDKIIATGSASGGHGCLGLAFGDYTKDDSDGSAIPHPAAIIDMYAPKNFAHPWWTGPRDKLDVNVPPLTAGMERLVFEQHPVPSRVDLPTKPDSTGKIVLPENLDPSSTKNEREDQAPSFTAARVAYATNVITEHRLLDVCWPYPDNSQSAVSATEHYRPIDPILNVHAAWPPTCFLHGIDDNLLPHTVTTEPLVQALEAEGARCKFIGIEGAKHMFVMSLAKGSREWGRMKEAMDWVAEVIEGR